MPAPLRLEPFLHFERGRIYNTLTDLSLVPGERGYEEVRKLADGALTPASLSDSLCHHLVAAGWLIEDSPDLASRFLLKYVSIEAHTLCNQACYFCPVSISPRDEYFMPMDFYEEIVSQVAEYRPTIKGVSMIHYNEPTVDRRFADQVRLLRQYELPPFASTNGTGLTPKTVDAILDAGGLEYLCINLSTLDQERYQKDRRGDHLGLVMKNLDYAKDQQVAPEMDIVVLGRGDATHEQDFQEISERFAGTLFNVKHYEVMDRAGHMPVGVKPAATKARLCGCEQTGSRPLQWVHITPQGKCVLCCQDYNSDFVVGDLTEETLTEVLSGPAIALMRSWVYGLEEAPDDFICRGCVYALTG